MRWPGLGFDPAPGDRAGVDGLVTRLSATARHLQETHDTLAGLTRPQGGWSGDAAKAFTAALDVLPRYLVDAHESLRKAGDVLGQWHGALGGLQTRARDLEGQAVAARTDLAGVEEAERQARAHPDLRMIGQQFSAEDLPAAQARIDAAQAGLDRAIGTTATLRASLEDLIRRAGVLATEHQDAARGAANGVRGADDGLAPPEPGWLEQAVGWVGDNLGAIGDVAGVVSGIASALALIPILTPIAGPIALISGGVALLAHGADLVVNDRWRDPAAVAGVVADTLGVIPGVRLAGEAIGAGAAMARASFTTVPGVTNAIGVGLDGARMAAAPHIADMSKAGVLAGYLGDRVIPVLAGFGSGIEPTAVAKVIQGAIDAGPQVPTVNSMLSGEEYQVEKNFATGATIAGEVGDRWVQRVAAAAAS